MNRKAAVLICAFVLFSVPALSRDLKKPLRFERGASSATIEGAVVRGDRDVYELSAKTGQIMTVTIKALEDNAAIVIKAPGGKALPGAGDGDDAVTWEGQLPATGTYRIEAGGTRGNAEYTLSVAIR